MQSALDIFQKYCFCEDCTNLFWTQMFLLEFLETNLGQFGTFPLPKLARFCDVDCTIVWFSSSWNVDIISWYVILRALSCIYFIVKTSTVKHPNWRTITKLRSYERLHDCSSLLYIHVGSDSCKAFNFWLAFLPIPLVCFSKVRLKSFVTPSNTCSCQDFHDTGRDFPDKRSKLSWQTIKIYMMNSRDFTDNGSRFSW